MLRRICASLLFLGLGCPRAPEKEPDRPPPRTPPPKVAPVEIAKDCGPLRIEEAAKSANGDAHTVVVSGEVDDAPNWTRRALFESRANEFVVEHFVAQTDRDAYTVYVATAHRDGCVRLYAVDVRPDGASTKFLFAKRSRRRWVREFFAAGGGLYFRGVRHDLRGKPQDDKEPKTPRDRRLSPDGRKKIVVTDTALVVEEDGKRRTVLDELFSENWAFSGVDWATDEVFYFDNTGSVACIWEYDLAHDTLRKIVGDHDAEDPRVFVGIEDDRHIFYRRPGGVYVTSHAPPFDPPWTRQTDIAAMRRVTQRYPTDFKRLERAGDEFIIRKHCEAAVPTISLSAKPDIIEIYFGYGQDGEIGPVTGTSTRADAMVVTYVLSNNQRASLKLQYEAKAKVWWGAGGSMKEPVPYAAAADEAAFRTVAEDCSNFEP